MRKVFSVALMAAAICLAGIAKDASANVTFSIVFVSTTGAGVVGSNTIVAGAGDILGIELRMTTDQTLGGHGVSINFDTDLGNELNLLGAGEWAGITFGAMAGTNYASINAGLGPPAPFDSTGASGGRISTYESGQLTGTGFLPVGTYVIGTASFAVTANVATDGNDLFTGLFNVGVDDVLNNSFGVIPIGNLSFEGAAVNVIPEPGTASLLGLGLVGLVLAGRRSRRS